MMTRLLISTATAVFFTLPLPAANHPLEPRLSDEWWTVAGDPDLGPLTTPNQQPVDFAIWPAADGTWQIWSCIRGTKEPGKTRLFHRWEGAELTDRNWTPKGIALQADPALGETRGGLQAPYVLRHDGKFWMFYGDWANICLATSTDGKTFTRQRNAEGKPQLNFAGKFDRDRNGRDPMVLRIGGRWHLYYTAHPGNQGFDYARTSDDLLNWGEERIVAARGKSGDGPYSAECPFVVEPLPGHYYLFRTQRYGQTAQTMVYHSRDPLDFGLDNDAGHYVTTLPVAAPEIFQHGGQWYMAALLPSLKGIQITRMEWAPVPAPDRPAAFDPSTLSPFTSGALYLGKHETGLYPGAKNEMPLAHRQAGERIAAGIRPLDRAGRPDDQNGRMVALAIGHSNCRMYFGALQKRLASHAAELHPRFELLNAAVGGQQLPEIVRLQGPVWDSASKLLSRPGYSTQQVQILFLHTTYHGWKNERHAPPGEFPQTMQQMQRDLATVLRQCLRLYPNLKLAYLTCDGFRHFTGFEPHVWQEAFAMKWLIASQMAGEPALAFAGPEPRLPWLAWGPYFWDNRWDRSNFTDGVHPAPKALDIFVDQYWQHLSRDPVAKPWLLNPSKKPVNLDLNP